MKREAVKMPQAGSEEDRLPDLSAEGAIERELAKLGEWLAAQGLDPWGDHVLADEGSRDRLYWRYGYFTGLKQALAMLTGRGATLH